MNRIARFAALAVWTIALTGCERSPAPATSPATERARTQPEATQPATDQAATAPDVPLELDREALVSDVLIKDTTVAERHRKEKYKRDPAIASGAVRGVCYVPRDKDVSFTRSLPLWPGGENAVKDAQEGEVDYYRLHCPRKWFPLGTYDQKRKRYGVGQAVVIFRDIQAGRRQTLGRPSFIASHETGHIQVPQRGYNHGSGNVGFGPVYERVQLANTEFFDCQIEITHVPTGKVFFACKLHGYNDPRYPRQRYGTKWGMVPLRLMQTPPLLETGRYVITCKKHPWHRAHLFVVDNPYVCVSGSDGSFSVSGIPEGEYAVDLWHPEYEPIQGRLEVKVGADRTTELAIEFRPPAVLADPPKPTDRHVRQWVHVGPFPYNIRGKPKVYPPEKQLDFDATYEGKGKARVGWKVLNARKSGAVDLWEMMGAKAAEATWYLAAQIESPRQQGIMFGLSMAGSGKMWLNGHMLYATPIRQRRSGGYYMGKLDPGNNTLLVRFNTGGRPYDCGMSVAYKAPDVKVTIPAGEGLREGYVRDPALEAGTLKGVCYVPYDKPVHIPRRMQLDLSGAMALRQPQEGEAAHYSGSGRPARSVWLGGFDAKQKRYPVRRAVVSVLDVRSGRRIPLKAADLKVEPESGWAVPEFRTDQGHIRYADYNVVFTLVNEPIGLMMTDIFPYHLVIGPAGGGKAVCEVPVPAYKDKYFPGRVYKPRAQGMRRPATLRIPPIAECGRYLMACKRHPWFQTHLFVMRHPYATVTNDAGGFGMTDLPPGKHVVEVWHPDFEPTKKTFQVQVQPGKATELAVEFKVPAILPKLASFTDRNIVEWVYAGPFKGSDGTAYPPEKQVDFKATYKGSHGPVGWKRINANRSGLLDLPKATGRNIGGATWYLCSLIDSPRAQRIALGVGSSEQCRVFLNGRLIYARPESHRYARDEDYAVGDLQAGRNVLLVKLTAGRSPPALSVTYKAPGAKAAPPADQTLRPAYLWDERLPAGQLKGICYVPFDKHVTLPSRVPLELAGQNALRDPQPGEETFFKSYPPARDVWVGRFDAKEKRYCLPQAALVLSDVRSGGRYPLSPTGMTVNYQTGRLESRYSFNRGRYNIDFSRTGLPVGLSTAETFPSLFVLTHAATGKVVGEVSLPPYKDSRYPGTCFNARGGMSPPRTVATPPLAAPGRYVLACKRHPWRRAYLFVMDHPYGALSDANGAFGFGDVPAGKYTLQVWHPECEPLKASLPVTVKPGKTVELAVEFKVPDVLKAPPPVPTQRVARWVVLGPFDAKQKLDNPPEKRLDFAAKVKGKGGAEVSWRLSKADGGGRLRIGRGEVVYFYATLAAPAARKAVLSLSADDYVTVWVNGGLAYSGRSGMVLAALKKGSNALLARLVNVGGQGSLSITYHAQGVAPGPLPVKEAKPAAGAGSAKSPKKK